MANALTCNLCGKPITEGKAFTGMRGWEREDLTSCETCFQVVGKLIDNMAAEGDKVPRDQVISPPSIKIDMNTGQV